MNLNLFAMLILLVQAGAAPSDPSQAARVKALAEERDAEDRRNEADPCLRRDGDSWELLRWRECLKLGPAMRMRGVWYYGFEESGFVPNVQTVPLLRRMHVKWRELDTVLDVDLEQVTRVRRVKLGLPCTTAITIDFIGREAVLPEGSSVQPTANRIIAVDRVLDARLVGIVRTVGRPRQCPKRVD